MRIVKLKGMRQMNGLHYAPDGRRLLAVGGYEVRGVDEARWVDVGAGTETLRVPLRASCYAVSPDLTRMAVGNSHTTGNHIPIPPVVTFDPTDPTWHENESRWREVEVSHDHPTQVHGLAFTPDSQRLAISCNVDLDGTRVYWFTLTDPNNREPQIGHPVDEGTIYSLITFRPDRQRMAVSVGMDSYPDVALLTGDGRECIRAFVPPSNLIRQLAFAPDGNTLAVVNGKAVLFDAVEPSGLRHTLTHPKQVNAVAFTPNGRRVLTTCTDKLVRVWDMTTGQLVTSYDWNVGVTNAIAVAPDGLTAAVSGQSGRVVLFDLEG